MREESPQLFQSIERSKNGHGKWKKSQFFGKCSWRLKQTAKGRELFMRISRRIEAFLCTGWQLQASAQLKNGTNRRGLPNFVLQLETRYAAGTEQISHQIYREIAAISVAGYS
jgi:hypothetical protein